MQNPLELRRLEIFCRVVELKNFSKAAEGCSLSQPTVSENIRLLEEAVGERLLDRLGREVLPTPAGKLLFGYARQLLRVRDQAWQALRQFRGDISGGLSLGGSTPPGTYLLPRLIESFKSRHGAIQVSVRIADSARTIDELLHGVVELGIIGTRSRDSRIEAEPLFTDELVLVVPPGHAWSNGHSVTLAELAHEPFILREDGSGTRAEIAALLREAGLDLSQLQTVAEMGSSEAVRQCVKTGLGVSILSRRVVEEDLAKGTLHQVRFDDGRVLRREFFLVRRRGRQLSPLAEAFEAHLRADRH